MCQDAHDAGQHVPHDVVGSVANVVESVADVVESVVSVKFNVMDARRCFISHGHTPSRVSGFLKFSKGGWSTFCILFALPQHRGVKGQKLVR